MITTIAAITKRYVICKGFKDLPEHFQLFKNNINKAVSNCNKKISQDEPIKNGIGFRFSKVGGKINSV
jgi:hypothetical protein